MKLLREEENHTRLVLNEEYFAPANVSTEKFFYRKKNKEKKKTRTTHTKTQTRLSDEPLCMKDEEKKLIGKESILLCELTTQ